MHRYRATFAISLVSLTLILTGCGAAGSSEAPVAANSLPAARSSVSPLSSAPGSVIMGSADFPESEILAYVYSDAMAARGVAVTMHTGVGERPAYISALNDGSITAIPEYSGALLDYLDTAATEKSSADVYRALQSVVASHGYEVGAEAPAQDVDTITVTGQTASKYHLTSISDLRAIAAKLSLGAPAPFQTVDYGIPGLKKTYGVRFGRFVPLSAGGSITQTALLKGTVDAADIFSTDPSIGKDGFVSLKDPQNLFNAENVVPLFKQGTLTTPMKEASDAVSAKLTTGVLRGLLTKVAAGGNVAQVALAWDKANGLVSK